MKTTDKSGLVLSFYHMLHELVTTTKFDAAVAKALVATYDQERAVISLDTCTVKSLRSCHREYHDQRADLDRMEDLAECAFLDLASQMRNPEAQKVCTAFQGSSGTSMDSDLYVHLRSMRLLGGKKGAAVVTLVVSSGSTLLRLLKKGPADAGCEFIHFSEPRKKEPAPQ